MRSLTGGEAPGFIEHLLEEGRLQLQVLGDDVETEQVSVYAAAGHRVLVAELVTLSGLQEQLHALLDLCSKTLREVRFEPFSEARATNTDRAVGISHGAGPGTALIGAGADGLRAALAVQTSHGRLVGEAETTRRAEVRQLQHHLDEGVGRHATLLHET